MSITRARGRGGRSGEASDVGLEKGAVLGH